MRINRSGQRFGIYKGCGNYIRSEAQNCGSQTSFTFNGEKNQPYLINWEETPEIITIKRGKHDVMNIFIWHYKNLQKLLPK